MSQRFFFKCVHMFLCSSCVLAHTYMRLLHIYPDRIYNVSAYSWSNCWSISVHALWSNCWSISVHAFWSNYWSISACLVICVYMCWFQGLEEFHMDDLDAPANNQNTKQVGRPHRAHNAQVDSVYSAHVRRCWCTVHMFDDVGVQCTCSTMLVYSAHVLGVGVGVGFLYHLAPTAYLHAQH